MFKGRAQNLRSLILSVGGKVTEEDLDKLEQKEKETDDKERQSQQEKLNAIEVELNAINSKLRDHSRAKEDQNILHLQFDSKNNEESGWFIIPNNI